MKFLTAFLIILPIFSFAEQDQKIDRKEVSPVIIKNLESIITCYIDGLTDNPNAEGKVVIEWDLSSNGSVSKASVKSSTLKDEAIENCVVEKIKSLKFPAPPKGKTANFSYPFVFSKKK